MESAIKKLFRVENQFRLLTVPEDQVGHRFNNMRRPLIIAAIVIVFAGLGVAAYFYFFSPSPSVEVAPEGAVLPVAGEGTFPIVEEPQEGEGFSANPSPTAVSARLVKISAGPVVFGEVVTDSRTTSATSSPETTVSYIERQSGNLFTYRTQARTITRTSNRTIPGIQSASWVPNGSLVFLRYLSGSNFSTINTYGLSASGSSGYFLPQNLADLAVSENNVLMLSSGVNGSTASLARTDGSGASTAFSTPLTSLRVFFAGKSQYLAVTKASSALPGSAFLVDSGGRFSRVAGPHKGLVALPSPSGKWLLVSYTLDDAMQFALVNTATNESFQMPVSTIADKCVWASNDSVAYCGIPLDPPANASYPDDWYQGATHFKDRIWKIEVSGRYVQLALDLTKEIAEPVDAVSLAINPSGTVLVFVNKNDGSLWSYSL